MGASVLNVGGCSPNTKKPGRRGQPRRLSKLQREIIAFYSRGTDCAQSRDLDGEYRRTRDPLLAATFRLFFTEDGGVAGGLYTPQSFYRSRRNLIDKGYLEQYRKVDTRGYMLDELGHRLTDKAVAEFLGGDRSKSLPPGPVLAELAQRIE